MGIARFQRWLIATFPEIVRVQGNRFGQVYDHVAFDLNQILHQAARKATDRHGLAAAVFRELDEILKNCIPRKSIFFAFDGPGPIAKLVTQRKRRSRARVEHVSTRQRGKGTGGRARYAPKAIDRLELTPGVETLYYLRDAVEYWAYTRLQNDRKYSNVDVRISGPDTPGEGELKVIDFCRIGIKSARESIVVVGGDADIVLQGLATTPVRDFFVYLRHFGAHGRKRVNYVLSVWELTRSLERLFPGDSTGARLDFILLSIMNGNDYVPKARGVSLSRLWGRYRALKSVSNKASGVASFKGQFIVNAEQRTFNWAFLYRLLENVGPPVPPLSDLHVGDGCVPTNANGSATAPADGAEEGNLSHVEEIIYTGDEQGIPMIEFDEYPSESWVRGENGTEDEDESSSGSSNDNGDDDDEFLDDDEQHFQTLLSLTNEPKKLVDVERWLRVLLWTLHMYVDGHCADYTFQYGKAYGPSCDIITDFIDEHNGDPFAIIAPVSHASPLKPHAAALAMLPKHASHLLPGPLRDLAMDPSASKRIFPSIDVVDVSQLVHEISKIPKTSYSDGELKLTRHGKPLVLRLSQHRMSRGQNPFIAKPGPRFHEIRHHPVLQREGFPVTEYPRCYRWPASTQRNLLRLPYMLVGGTPLKSLARNLR